MTQNTEQDSNEAPSAAQSENAHGDRSREQKPSLRDQLREGGSELLDSGKQRLVGRIGCYESAFLDASSKLSAEDHVVLARQLESAADSVGGVRQYLGERSPEELLEEASDFCKRHPAACFTGAFVAGLAAARFLKASAPKTATVPKHDINGDDDANGRSFGE
ncbi:MAG: hypothetical protein ACI9R3_005548 [Verrucomicrobiales bacterium]|jgi:hypothetical protein